MCVRGKRWNSEIFSLFSKEEAESIIQIPINQLGLSDKLVWHHTIRGNYWVAFGYSQQVKVWNHFSSEQESSRNREEEQSMWRRLWRMKLKGKIKHFLCRGYHNILPTCDRLVQKGMQLDDTWKLYREDKESLEHHIFHCKLAQIIWKLAPVNWEGIQDLTQNFQSWWRKVCLIGNDKAN